MKIKKDAKPFVKWVGGKRNIISEIIKYIPKKFNNYFEPFLGGGALFFELNLKNKVFLSDVNKELIITYSTIKNDCANLLLALGKHRDNNNVEYFYKIRAKCNFTNNIKIASRFIFRIFSSRYSN